MKRYGVLINYTATKGVRSTSNPDKWLIEPTDEHQYIVDWHDFRDDAETSAARLADLVGVSNIDAIEVIEVVA